MTIKLKDSGFLLSIGVVGGILAGRYLLYFNLFNIVLFCFAIIFLNLILIFYVGLKDNTRFRLFQLIGIILFFLISFSLAGVRLPHNEVEINRIIAKEVDFLDSRGVIIGEVRGDVTKGKNLDHYPFQVKTFDDKKITGNDLIRLSYDPGASESGKVERFFPGDELKVVGRVHAAPVATNPGEFDYREFLYSRGKNYVLYPEEVEKVGSKFNLVSMGTKLADFIKDILENNLPERGYSWVSSVSFGDTSALKDHDRENLHKAGMGHMVAVSGLHMGIIGMGLFTFLKKNSLERRYAGVITLAVIWFYATMVGFRPSVLRAGIMLTIFILLELVKGREKGKFFSSLDSLLFSFNFILLVYPWYLFNIGFQLSFAATFFILLVVPYMNEVASGLKPSIFFEPVKVSIAALLGVFPLLLYHFGYVSFGSMLLSPFVFFALPLLIILTFIGSSLAIFSFLSNIIFSILNYLSIYMFTLIDLTADIMPGLEKNWSMVQVFCYYGMFLSLFYILKSSMVLARLRRAYLSLAIFSILFISVSLTPFLDKELQVVFLDVGHGDSIFINTPGDYNILIDGGGVHDGSLSRDPGESVVKPFLKDRMVDEINVMIATHPHVDHIGGLRKIVKNFDVGIVIMPDLDHQIPEYQEFLYLIEKKEISTLMMTKRKAFEPEEGLVLEFLHPVKPYLLGTNSDLNNNSVVMRLMYEDVSFLFTGDLEAEGEMLLLEQELELDSDILKVGHHGSSTSSTAEFVKNVSPVLAVNSAGRSSPYGFPAPETLERLARENTVVIRTEQWGAVEVITCGERIRVETFLEEKIY